MESVGPCILVVVDPGFTGGDDNIGLRERNSAVH